MFHPSEAWALVHKTDSVFFRSWSIEHATWQEEEEIHKQYILGFEKAARKEGHGKLLERKYEPVVLKEAKNVGWV